MFVQEALPSEANGPSYDKHFVLPWNDPVCSLLFTSNSTALERFSEGVTLISQTPSTTCRKIFIGGEIDFSKILHDLKKILAWERFCILYTDEYGML